MQRKEKDNRPLRRLVVYSLRYPIRIPVVFDIEYRHSLRNTAKKGTIMNMISAKITLISCICAKLIRCLRLTWRTGNLHTAGESATAWSW